MAEDAKEPLSQEDIGRIQKYLSNPLHFPTEFKTWLPNYVAQEIPQLPVIQALGGRGIARYLGVDASSSAISGNTAVNTVYTLKIPGKRVAQNGRLVCWLFFNIKCADVSNIVEIAFKLGGTVIGLINDVDTDTLDATARPGALEVVMINAGNYAVQHSITRGGYLGEDGRFQNKGFVLNTTVDTSVDKDFTITVQWGGASADAVLTKLYASVEVFNPIGF